MAKGIKRKIRKALNKIQGRVARSIDRTNIYSSGLAWEGYDGGYIAALRDVLLLLDGVTPSRDCWEDEEQKS